MDLCTLLSPERIVASLRAADKGQLLAELARRASSATGISTQDIQDGLFAREALGSTGIGGGVAIPHARLLDLKSFFALFVRLERGLDFEAIDGQPVDLVCLLLVPTHAAGEHLRALACISRPLRNPVVLASLRQAENASAIHAIFSN